MLYLNKILLLFTTFVLLNINAQSWQKIENPIRFTAPLKFAIDAENGDILAISDEEASAVHRKYRIFFSTDNGNTWQKKKIFQVDRALATIADIHIHSRTKRWYLGFDFGFIWFSRDQGLGFTNGSSEQGSLRPSYVHHLDESSLGDGMLWHLGSAPDGFNFSPQLAAEALESYRTVAMKDGSNLAVGYHASEQKSGVFKASPGGSVLFSELRQWNQQYHKNCKPVWGKTYAYHDIQLDSSENIYCLINTRLNVVNKSNNTIYDIDSLLPKQQDFYHWLQNLNYNKVDKNIYVLRNGILYYRKNLNQSFTQVPTEFHINEYGILKNGNIMCITKENGLMQYHIDTKHWTNIDFEEKTRSITNDMVVLNNGSLLNSTNNGLFIKNELWQDWTSVNYHFDSLRRFLFPPFFKTNAGEIVARNTFVSTKDYKTFNKNRYKGLGTNAGGSDFEIFEIGDQEIYHHKRGGRMYGYNSIKDSWFTKQIFENPTPKLPYNFSGKIRTGKNQKMYLDISSGLIHNKRYYYYVSKDTFKTMDTISFNHIGKFVIADGSGNWYLNSNDSLFYSSQEGENAQLIPKLTFNQEYSTYNFFGDTLVIAYNGKIYEVLNGIIIDSLHNNMPMYGNTPAIFTKFYKYKTGEYLGVTRGEGYLYTKRNLKIDQAKNTVKETLKLYPNPTNNQIQFNITAKQPYVIYNTNGKIVASGITNFGLNTISVSTLIPGFYFIKTALLCGKFYKTP